MKLLTEFLNCIASLEKPKTWVAALKTVEREHSQFNKLISSGCVSIYGLNTKPGHRDIEKIEFADMVEYQHELLSSHTIEAGQPSYCEHAARCIGYAKAQSFSCGMSGISSDLFNSLMNLVVDESFTPKIPRYSSYSSGDVIPASHWATAVLGESAKRDGYVIQPGDAMALINGNFVHLGYAASMVRKLKTAWLFFVELSALSSNVSNANASNIFAHPKQRDSLTNAALRYIEEQTSLGQKGLQDPVSLRAIPQVINAMSVSIGDLLNEINGLLGMPSGNPLYDAQNDKVLSQASFLAPNLSIKASALIEAILLAMWSMVGRTNHLLSGDVEGVPKDAACQESSLALIQYPKYMMSVLEKSRLAFGRRIYSSGSETSYGTEDLWTNGVNVLNQLDTILDDFINVGACELYIFKYIQNHHCLERMNVQSFIRDVGARLSIIDITHRINEYFTQSLDSKYDNLFPV